MAVTKEKKVQLLEELITKMQKAKSIAFAEYANLSVAVQTQLRRKLKDQNAEMKVAKKTLIRLAAKEIGISNIPNTSLEGQIVIAISYQEAVTGPKIIKEMSKKNKQLKLTGGIFEGRALSLSDITELAELPSKEVLIAKFLGTLNAPIQGFTTVTSGVMSGFARVLQAHVDNVSK